MTPDLKSFAGLHRDDICRQLKNEGYEILRRGGLCTVFHQPGSDVAVRVSMTPATSAMMCDCFQKNAQNPYLPKVYEHAIINDRAHVSIIEKLVSLEELAEEDENHVMFGMARAISSFAFGDTVHDDVHKEFAKDTKMIAAVRALVNCAQDAFHKLGKNGDSLFLDRNVDGILFRREENGGLQPVFANSLCYTTPSASQNGDFDNIQARLRKMEQPPQMQKSPAFARPGTPAIS